MKRIFYFIAILIITATLQAQNQQAIVKTRGKLDDKGNVIPGRGLSGAFVKIKDGNTHESKDEGLLSFPVPGGKYFIEKVTYVDRESQEQYQLVDLDELGRQHEYSAKPKDILVATQYEMNEDRLDEEMRAREVLMVNYRKRQEEIKRLQAENRISREEAQHLRQQLVEAQANEEKLISDMAERYSKMDFDRMSDFDRKFAYFIRSGQLVSADSLLRTQGDVFAMEDTLRMIRKENAAGREVIADKEASLARDKAFQAQNEEYENLLLEKIADNYYKRYEIFSQQYRHDSAAYYLERRAMLDTTNAAWQFDVGFYFARQKQYHKVESYYMRALELYRQSENEPDLANTLNNLANHYFVIQSFAESEVMYKEALKIYRRLADNDPLVHKMNMAMTLSNMSNLYQKTQRLTESKKMYMEAMDIFIQFSDTCQIDGVRLLNEALNLMKQANHIADFEEAFDKMLNASRLLAKNDPQTYDPHVAQSLNNLAKVYCDTRRFAESEVMYQEALGIYRRLAVDNPQAYEPDLANTLNALANVYCDTQRFAESEVMYQEALEIFRILAVSNPQAYEPEVAMSLNNLGNIYSVTQRLAESEVMYKESLEIRRRLAVDNPQVYEPNVAETLYNLAVLWTTIEKSDLAIQLLEEALTIYRKAVMKDLGHRYGYEGSLFYLGMLYSNTHNHVMAYNAYNELLPLLKGNYQEDPENEKIVYSGCLGSLSFQCIFMSKFAEAEQYAREGLEIDNTQTFIYTNLAASFLFQGKYRKAEQLYRQYKEELKEGFLSDFEAFEKANVIPKKYKADVEKIKLLLHE